MKTLKYVCILALLLALTASLSLAQSPVKPCTSSTTPSWCSAVRGDRPGNWLGQGRSETMSQHGMVATSQSLAAEAGLRVLMAGGNAIDAAVATAATLNLVEPMNVGIGGDLYAIIYIAKDHKLYQLNAGDMMPEYATVDYYKSQGYVFDPTNWGFGSGMPSRGFLSAPVPGAAWGWDEAHRRFGKLSLLEDLTPAIEYAENGFPITEIIGNGWSLPNATGCTPAGCTAKDQDSVNAWYVNGQRPTTGTIFKNPDLARTLRLFGKHGREVFYKGEIARAIVKKMNSLATPGAQWTMDDLADYYGQWDTPAHTTFKNSSGVTYDVYETMAPSQAWNVVELMNILEACVPVWSPTKSLAQLGPTDPLYWHLLVEAKKLASVDLYDFNSDPRTWDPAQWQTFHLVTSKPYAATLCSKVSPTGPAFTPTPSYNGLLSAAVPGVNTTFDGLGDTIYLTTADRWGNMVSWVNSNYSGFGSGITIPGYGFVINDRAAQFTLDPNHPNRIAPSKRPYNTISAGFVMQGGVPLLTLGLMGGDMQVQGHAQMLVNMLELGANPQASTDMARFYHNEVPNTLALESQLYNLVGSTLKNTYGHKVSSTNGGSVGGYQSIMFTLDPTAPVPDFRDHHGKDWDDRDDHGKAWGDVGKSLLEVPPPVNGFYRAGTDHRKDGEAVGW